MQREYTAYVVVNREGYYLSPPIENIGTGPKVYFEWLWPFQLDCLLAEYVTAEWRALNCSGKVKEVTITIKD